MENLLVLFMNVLNYLFHWHENLNFFLSKYFDFNFNFNIISHLGYINEIHFFLGMNLICNSMVEVDHNSWYIANKNYVPSYFWACLDFLGFHKYRKRFKVVDLFVVSCGYWLQTRSSVYVDHSLLWNAKTCMNMQLDPRYACGWIEDLLHNLKCLNGALTVMCMALAHLCKIYLPKVSTCFVL